MVSQKKLSNLSKHGKQKLNQITMMVNDHDDHDNNHELSARRNLKRIHVIRHSLSCQEGEGKWKEAESPRTKLLVLFYSLISRLGSTTFCQKNMLLLYDLSHFVQIQHNIFNCFFFASWFSWRTFTIHRTSGEGVDYHFKSSLPLPSNS